MKIRTIIALCFIAFRPHVPAAVIQYGDKDVLGTRTYPTDPVTGATLSGSAAGTVTFGAAAVSHSFPFSPSAGDFPGTDQIYIGSTQTASLDGYSRASVRIPGPQTIVLDYDSIVLKETVTTFTLGIGADDFQFPTFGQPFTALINGVSYAPLNSVLNNLINQTGPYTQFFSIGLPLNLLTPDHRLNLQINEGGNGGDGWAIDFLTVGVTSQPAPEPSCGLLTLVGAALLVGRRRRA